MTAMTKPCGPRDAAPAILGRLAVTLITAVRPPTTAQQVAAPWANSPVRLKATVICLISAEGRAIAPASSGEPRVGLSFCPPRPRGRQEARENRRDNRNGVWGLDIWPKENQALSLTEGACLPPRFGRLADPRPRIIPTCQTIYRAPSGADQLKRIGKNPIGIGPNL